MEIFSPGTRRPGVEQRPRGAFMGALPLVRNGAMPLLAILLAVTFAKLVCG